MSYNKKAHLRANIEAIRTVLILDKEKRTATDDEKELMQGYSGFGGLKCVLNPANSLTDISSWSKSELDLFPLVAELHRTIRDITSSEKEYKQYFDSIRNSVLTAFYTPPEIVQAIGDAIKDSGIDVNRFLDPSAGMGEFSRDFMPFSDSSIEKISFEKDLLTGGKNGKNDPLKTAENDPLKLCRSNSKKLFSGLGSKRRRFKPELNLIFIGLPR